jgi:hypothetical protein
LLELIAVTFGHDVAHGWGKSCAYIIAPRRSSHLKVIRRGNLYRARGRTLNRSAGPAFAVTTPILSMAQPLQQFMPRL